MNIEVKICGINSVISMKASNKADFIGFVFFPKSPRFINAENAKYLANLSPKTQKKVGLFVNTEINVIEFISEYVNLDYIQLHGEEGTEEIDEIKKKTKKPIIKSIKISTEEDLENVLKFETVCDMILFDAVPSEELPGGNGKAFNWNILKNYSSKKKWMLAGGINKNNVHRAVKITQAPIIDLSSSLEVKKGVKCEKKIKEFLNIVKK
ncbi:MAG: hypothetical protein CMM91_03375 [Rickettsiales bacterium]|nr:hypothetical protein [Rickettsiales bacterium]OUV54098.1 MAG: hypothetical protein CBC87_02120 [Rickettsiales bacterium TMED127]|tara:strand:+ start:84959 stop:85585 length:627 start_codon:yes stop_codon:yes gene_type:complete